MCYCRRGNIKMAKKQKEKFPVGTLFQSLVPSVIDEFGKFSIVMDYNEGLDSYAAFVLKKGFRTNYSRYNNVYDYKILFMPKT